MTMKTINPKIGYFIPANGSYSLIGYVNDNVFKLNTYSSVKVPKLYARLTDKNDNYFTWNKICY